MAASPAPILGHLFAGDAMTVNIPWAHVEAARFILGCFIVGAVLGFISALVRPAKGERRGEG